MASEASRQTAAPTDTDKTPSIEPAKPGASAAASSKAPASSNGSAANASKAGSEEKLSNAELKKRAKAEKQARREKQMHERQASTAAAAAGSGSGGGPHQGDASSSKADAGRRSQTTQAGHDAGSKGHGPGAAKDGHKGHHEKRSEAAAAGAIGAAGMDGPKTLPVRTTVKRNASTTGTTSQKTGREVGLFGHLYGQPRRTTLAGAARDVHPAVLALGLQMSHYVICGSNARCVATLFCFKKVIESYVTPPGASLTRHLTSHLSPQIDYLRSCRPLSVSTGNAIRWLKLEISKVDVDTAEADAKARLCDAIDSFVRERITAADQVIATSAAEKIQDGDVIVTFAKSSLVQQTLERAHRRGRAFRVVVVDSKPLFEGRHLARALARAGLEVQYALMHAVRHATRGASKVLLGAHAMLSNGRLCGRVGSALVAMMAHEADVPVIVCCESVKFTERVALDSVVNNEIAPAEELMLAASARSTTGAAAADVAGSAALADENAQDPLLQPLNIMYDVTPAEYIKMVVTEFGSLPPSSVPVVHRLSTNS